MTSRVRNLRAAVGALVLALSAAAAPAAILNPGDAGALVGTDTVARPELGGTVLADAFRPFTIDGPAGKTTGMLHDMVVAGTDGALIFVTQIGAIEQTPAVTGAPAPAISTVIHRSFNAAITPTVETEFLTDGGGQVGPDLTGREAGAGEGVGFAFSNGLTPPNDSFFFFVRTSAPAFIERGAYVIIDAAGQSTEIQAYAPAAIPEPATASLLALPALALLRRRRQA